jgi:hypothetical protein
MAVKKKITINTANGEVIKMDAPPDCQVSVKITGSYLNLAVENIGNVKIEEVE